MQKTRRHKNAIFLIEAERLTMTVNVSTLTDQHADKEQMNVKNIYVLRTLSVILTQNEKKKSSESIASEKAV